jgi:hypothetical protein
MQFTSALLVLFGAASVNALAIRQANSQSFTGALGGIAATPILDSGNDDRPFAVKGDTFVNLGAALQRSCDQQFNACANQANAGAADFSTQECTAQKSKSILMTGRQETAANGLIRPMLGCRCCARLKTLKARHLERWPRVAGPVLAVTRCFANVVRLQRD